MKLLNVSLFLMVLLAFSSCKKDDDDVMDTCTQADWVGTYAGTIDCDGTTENVTITITASGTDDIIVKYETTSVSAEYDPLPITGCDFNNTASGGGFTASVDATLAGDDLTVTESLSDGTDTTTCTLTVTRQ